MRFCFEPKSQWKVKVAIFRLQLDLQTCSLVEKLRLEKIEESFIYLFLCLYYYFTRIQALGKAQVF